jgi:hypothetical protein
LDKQSKEDAGQAIAHQAHALQAIETVGMEQFVYPAGVRKRRNIEPVAMAGAVRLRDVPFVQAVPGECE